MLTPALAAQFHASGFAVLRGFFAPDALATELDVALEEGEPTGVAAIRFRYAPMMSGVSLSLLDRLEPAAAQLLGAPVLPTRAKGVRYQGGSPWHADSVVELATIGCLAYLEPLCGDTGALRVVPGSHRAGWGAGTLDARDGHALETVPGDVILMDEHLLHASTGGTLRRQWRVDFVRAPRTIEERTAVRAWFAGIFPPEWDGGYDPDRHPSYGSAWLHSRRPAVAQLRDLGVYDLANAQETFMRDRRRAWRLAAALGTGPGPV